MRVVLFRGGVQPAMEPFKNLHCRRKEMYIGWLSLAICKKATVQSALHFTSLTDLFTKTPSWLLWEASSHLLQLMRECCSYKYPPLSIARYSFIQLSEQEQCRVKNLPKVLPPQHRIQTRVLEVESPELYP